MAALYEWVSGFEEAIALRDELWDPEEYPDLSDEKKEELYHSIMTIQGLVDPVEAMDYFEDMPDELFQEAFSGLDSELSDREAQIQIFLMASLPLAIETLQDHARVVEKKRQRQLTGSKTPIPIRSAKIGRNDPCPCNSGKKYKKCCGSRDDKQAIFPGDISNKKSNVIHVDFPQHGKKKSSPAPVYQLKVALQGAKPPIWRRIQVPGDITLEQLHNVLRSAWTGKTCTCTSSLLIEPVTASLTARIFGKPAGQKTRQNLPCMILMKKSAHTSNISTTSAINWVHRITVEEVLPAQRGKPSPVLFTGRRASAGRYRRHSSLHAHP